MEHTVGTVATGRNSFYRSIIIGQLCLLVFALVSCTVLEADDDSLDVLFYNVENLFDATLDGTEYEEFTPAAGWSPRNVEDRLEKLGNALDAVRPRPDIVALVEVENRNLFDEIFDRYFVDIAYPYRVFSRNPGGATGVGLASRYPIVDVRVLQARAGAIPPLRPIIEVRLALLQTEIVVFVNHWKSKRGGAPSTEGLRRASARLLATRLAELSHAEEDLPILICGDLNETPREIEYNQQSYPTAILPAPLVWEWTQGVSNPPTWFHPERVLSEAIIVADSPQEARELSIGLSREVMVNGWSQALTDGSYWYYNRWEQIDHIMVNAAGSEGRFLQLADFGPVRNDATCDGNGLPVSWFQNSDGVSDHLPVMLSLDMVLP